MKRWSLARRVGMLAGLGFALLAVLAIAILGSAFDRALQRGLDLRLQGWLDTLAAHLETGPDGRLLLPRALPGESFERVFSGEYWQIQRGAEMLVAPSLWDARLPLDPDLPVSGTPVHGHAVGPRGQVLRLAQLRVLLPGSTDPVHLAVAADLAALRSEGRQFRGSLWLVLLALGAAAAVLLWLQLRLGLTPLRRLRAQLGAIAAGRRQRLDEDLGPDLAPVAERLHALLAQQARTVQRARGQAQDLAHALKTPLSVLRADLPQLPAAQADSIRRQLDQIGRHIERYLGEAQAQTVLPGSGVELAPVIHELCAMFERVHAARGLRFDAAVPTLSFAGEQTDLQEMLGNLMDNAGRFARQRVTVRAEPGAPGRLQITVGDDGPGLDDAAMARALRRGERLDTSEPGSGLGLDIVQRIATAYDGTLVLGRSPAGGLEARLDLPGGEPEAL